MIHGRYNKNCVHKIAIISLSIHLNKVVGAQKNSFRNNNDDGDVRGKTRKRRKQ